MSKISNKNKSVASARNANLVVFAVNGMVLASWLSRLPDVKQQMNLTTGALSILLLAVAAGSLIGLPIAGRISDRFGTKLAVRFGGLISLAGILVATIAIQSDFAFAVPMAGLFFFGFGIGVWDVAQNLEGTVIEQAQGSAIMPWFHAAFSGGTVLGALIGAMATSEHFPIGIHVPLAVAVTGILLWLGTARFLPVEKQLEAVANSESESKQRSAWTEPRTLLIGLMVLAAAFTEGTANDWTAVAFVDGHSTSSTVGVFGLATFMTFMTAGRIFGTKALDKFGRVTTLRFLFVSAVVGCTLVVFGGTAGAFAGAAIWGIGASLGFPVGMSAASDDPKLAARRISVVATMGYVAFLAGPPLIGFLGESVGILRALLAVGVVGALAFLAVPAAKPLTTNA